MTDQHMEHATRSPSGAHGWRRCPGKINAEKGLPDRVGIEAAEGTVFHEYAERCLTKRVDPVSLPTGEKKIVSGHIVSYNTEMIENMYGGLDYIYAILEKYPDAILFVETRVKIEPWTLEENGFGTSDVIVVIPSLRKIIVFDWKYGKVAVSPIENDQLILYGLGVWETVAGELFDWEPEGVDIELTIWQPRVPDAGGTWETNMTWLLAEGRKVMIDALATYNPDARRVPGEKQCKYCRAAGTPRCPEYSAFNADLVGLRFEDIEDDIQWTEEPSLPDVFELTAERRSYVWLHHKMIKKWLEKLHDAIMIDYAKGQPTPYLKVVAGNKGKREYLPMCEDAAAAAMLKVRPRAQVYKESVISPSAAQDLLGKRYYDNEIKQFVTQTDPAPILVPITHAREAIPSKMVHFDTIEAEEEED